ncbi:glycoprotein hormone alpha-2 isoform X4 [Alosa alosa]|nr:glycoprotein hormone alpha-2 isoform X4 [Alosa alosa]
MTYDDFVNEELEDAIRIVLAGLDTLQPFATKHFNIFPYKCRWERVSNLRFELNGVKLSPYPHLITLYVEPRIHSLAHAAGKQTEDWDVTVSKQDASRPSSPGRPRKRSKKEQPPESTLRQPIKDAYSQQGGHQDSPELTDGAEAIECDSRFGVNAGLEECLNSMQDENLAEELPHDSEEETAPDEPEQESLEEEKPGLLTRLARPASPMSGCVTSGLVVLMVPLLALVLLSPISWSSEVVSPGCHLYPFNVTIRSDRKGTCRGTHVVYACVGYCESSAFPSRYSVLLASNFTHNITSASRCCTISRDAKVKVQLDCPRGRHHDDIEIVTAQACRCDMCRKSRY